MSNKFIMLTGLPGAGKTTLAIKVRDALIAETKDPESAVWISSDKIREELYGSEEEQGDPTEVFQQMSQRTNDALQAGKHVIYDACNLSSKKRRARLSTLKRFSGEKICVICATPYQECLRRNSQRKRVAREAVIKSKYMNWNTPYMQEGWDQIYIYYTENAKGFLGTPEEYAKRYMEYHQDTPYHQESLGIHLKGAQEYLLEKGYCEENSNLAVAALIHDCGKPFTKGFLDSRGNKSEIAHYYQHQCTGAYDALFFDYQEKSMEDVLEISTLINLHMNPFGWSKESTSQKARNLWGEKLYRDVLLLHEADQAASKKEEM